MNAALIESNHVLMPEYRPELRELDEIIELVEVAGISYHHSSGCAITNDGVWLQPEEVAMWLKFLGESEASSEAA